MTFTPIPAVTTGQVWTAANLQTLIDNQADLHTRVGPAPTRNYTLNQVIIGDSSGALKGVTLTVGQILVGTSGEPAALARGSTGQVLVFSGAATQWQDAPSAPAPTAYWRYL